MDTLNLDAILATTEDDTQHLAEELRTPEQVEIKQDAFDLDGISVDFVAAVNNTRLGMYNPYGQSLGGCRVMGYEWIPQEARGEYAERDAKLLARAMTNKWAALVMMGAIMAQEGKLSPEEYRSFFMGGGKSVIFVPGFTNERKWPSGIDPSQIPELFREYGRFVDKLRGSYITAPDSNTKAEDMDFIRETTCYVACYTIDRPDGIRPTGDPSIVTAAGVYHGMVALVDRHLGQSLDDLIIGIHGAGKVGRNLIRMIRQNHTNAVLLISEADTKEGLKLTGEYGGGFVPPEKMFSTPMDIYSPNLNVSEVLNEESVAQLLQRGRLSLIVGGSNVQLATGQNGEVIEANARMLHDADVFLMPDFVVNLGGILDLTRGFPGREATSRPEDSLRLVRGVHGLSKMVYDRVRETGILPYQMAEYMSAQVIAAHSNN